MMISGPQRNQADHKELNELHCTSVPTPAKKTHSLTRHLALKAVSLTQAEISNPSQFGRGGRVATEGCDKDYTSRKCSYARARLVQQNVQGILLLRKDLQTTVWSCDEDAIPGSNMY
eukprot:1549782-Rhodomonas_salina.1